MSRRVYVTGMGVVSSLGFGRKAFWNALLAGHSGARELSLFDTSELVMFFAPKNASGTVKPIGDDPMWIAPNTSPVMTAAGSQPTIR